VKADEKYLAAARQRVAARVRRGRWADALFQPQPKAEPLPVILTNLRKAA
jgi:hypothetical protein